MLEIILLVFLCKKIGNIVRGTGRERAWPYQVLLVVLFYAGEFIGGFAYGFMVAGQGGQIGDFDLRAIGCALVGGAIGAIIAFVIAKSLSPVHASHSGVDDDFDPSPDRFADPDNPYAGQ